MDTSKKNTTTTTRLEYKIPESSKPTTPPSLENGEIIPKIVFIVPYRNRLEHKVFFSKYMEYILEDYPKNDYKIYFVHQCDNRPFNRGAMKNIGYIAIRHKYPNHYKNITLVFHDVDNVPYDKNILHYDTRPGVVKHFYGFTYALGGIFSIKAGDFERTKGFPNFWAWGSEDNCIHQRVVDSGLYIDRSNFFPSGHKKILQFIDGLIKMISKKETADAMYRTCTDCIYTISNLKYEFKDEYINVYHFDTPVNPNTLQFEEYDIVKNNGVNKINLGKQKAPMANMSKGFR